MEDVDRTVATRGPSKRGEIAVAVVRVPLLDTASTVVTRPLSTFTRRTYSKPTKQPTNWLVGKLCLIHGGKSPGRGGREGGM